jgi:hypothetical protein
LTACAPTSGVSAMNAGDMEDGVAVADGP